MSALFPASLPGVDLREPAAQFLDVLASAVVRPAKEIRVDGYSAHVSKSVIELKRLQPGLRALRSVSKRALGQPAHRRS